MRNIKAQISHNCPIAITLDKSLQLELPVQERQNETNIDSPLKATASIPPTTFKCDLCNFEGLGGLAWGGLAHPQGTLACTHQCTVGHQDKRRAEGAGYQSTRSGGISTPPGDLGLHAPVHRRTWSTSSAW